MSINTRKVGGANHVASLFVGSCLCRCFLPGVFAGEELLFTGFSLEAVSNS